MLASPIECFRKAYKPYKARATATNHGQNNQLQLKYIQKKGLKTILTVHLVAAIPRETIAAHLTIFIGVNSERVDLTESKERFLKGSSKGFRESELGMLENEHLRGDKNWVLVVFRSGDGERLKLDALRIGLRLG
ncbi:hypothetical protein V6N13_010854 [Hibiscus sabdariffa]